MLAKKEVKQGDQICGSATGYYKAESTDCRKAQVGLKLSGLMGKLGSRWITDYFCATPCHGINKQTFVLLQNRSLTCAPSAFIQHVYLRNQYNKYLNV